MTTAEIAKALVEGGKSEANLEAMAKIAFLRGRGVWGFGLRSAVTAVANRHRTCLEMIQMGGDQFGAFGDKARRRSIENLADAENKLRSKVDRAILKRRLNAEWETYRAANYPDGYLVSHTELERVAGRPVSR